MRVQMKVESARGRPAAVLRFRLTDEAATPITDLEPYLGSAGHLLVVSPDLTHSIHAHPDRLGSGPELAFAVEFPEAGIYKLWVQMQRRGKVSAVPFVLRIDNSQPPTPNSQGETLEQRGGRTVNKLVD